MNGEQRRKAGGDVVAQVLQPVHAVKDFSFRKDVAARGDNGLTVAPRGGHVATVLIVSDALSSQLAVPIAAEGHRVTEADPGGDALLQILRLKPDVIVMPDDWESAEGMGLLPVVQGLTEAILVVVGSGDSTRRADALIVADVYVEGPVDRAQLLGRIRTLLRRSRSGKRERSDESLWPVKDDYIMYTRVAPATQ